MQASLLNIPKFNIDTTQINNQQFRFQYHKRFVSKINNAIYKSTSTITSFAKNAVLYVPRKILWKGSNGTTQLDFQNELLNHSSDQWKEFPLESDQKGLIMWKRVKPPIKTAIYMKFSSFFPGVSTNDMLPLLSDPSKRTWDPNWDLFEQRQQLSPDTRIVYARSHVPRWLKYLNVKQRDYVQEISYKELSSNDASQDSSYVVTSKSSTKLDIPEEEDFTRAHLHYQGALIEPSQMDGVKGTRVTVLSINDIKLQKMLYRFVGPVVKRYPIKWYDHLSVAAGCLSKNTKPFIHNENQYSLYVVLPAQ